MMVYVVYVPLGGIEYCKIHMGYTSGIKFSFVCQWQQITGQIISLNLLIVLVILLSKYFMSQVFYHLCIVGHKSHHFFDSFYYLHESWGKISCIIQLIQFYYDSTDFIFLMRSHAYFKTHIQYFHFQCYRIPTNFYIFWSHNLLLQNNRRPLNSKKSCYVLTDTIALICTY